MAISKLAVLVSVLGIGLAAAWAASGDKPATQPAATQPATAPSSPSHVVKRGSLSREIQVDGVLQAADPFEVRVRLKAHQGPLTVAAVAAHASAVKKDDVLLELDATDIKWAVETAEGSLAAAKAGQQKAEADAQVSVRSEALTLRLAEDSVKNAEAAVKWFETVDGPQMLLSVDLGVRQHKDFVDDQEDELDQLRKMYKTDDLNKATADIVIKRAVRREELSKIGLKMQEERAGKTKTTDYPIAKQKVLDALEQARNALALVKNGQEQASIVRKNSLTAARIAVEQAQRRLDQLRGDLAQFSIKAPCDGVVLYGNMADGAWQGGDPRAIKVGEGVAPGAVLMRLLTPGKLKVDVALSEAQAFWVEAGAKGAVVPAAFPQQSFEATIGLPLAMGKGMPGAFSFQAPVSIASPDARLLPGMRATVRFEGRHVENVLLVPLAAVAGGKVSVKMPDGKFEKHAVVVGEADAQNVEVREGLKEGDEILAVAKK